MSTENSPAGIEPDAIAYALTAFVNANIMARGRSVQPDDEFELMGIDSMALLKVAPPSLDTAYRIASVSFRAASRRQAT